MIIQGKAKKNLKTKALIPQLTPNDIAVIHHKDLDGLAAIQLAEKKIKAVINAAPSISGKYPNKGPTILSNSDIPIIDNIGEDIFKKINDNDLVELKANKLYINGVFQCQINLLDKKDIEKRMEEATKELWNTLDGFIENTLEYAKREKDLIISPVILPDLKVDMAGRHVLIVVRGENYHQDLRAIKTYIDEIQPVIIGVDGGANAIIDCGYKPDIIIGDMDSVSDSGLKCCGEIVVHAYRDGQCPGLKRIEDLGLCARKFPFVGTSEDAALVLAYEEKAELIVTVGSHTNMIDFLEKGRPGMASTILVRMKLGHKIIDAKGVSQLYKNKVKASYIAAVFAATLFPLTIAAKTSPLLKGIYKMVSLRLRILFGL